MTDITPIKCNSTAPIIQYEIAFPKQTNLLGGAAANVANEQTRAGISATLNDNIEWSSHIDEADKLDYIVAVSSGVLSGLIDAFFVGELSLNRASEWGEKQVNQIVMKVARSEGYEGDNLNDAIKSLERITHSQQTETRTTSAAACNIIYATSPTISALADYSFQYSPSSPAWWSARISLAPFALYLYPNRTEHALARTSKKRLLMAPLAGFSIW